MQTSNLSLIQISGEPVELQPGAGIVVHSEPRSVFADRFRFLRTHLRHLWNADKLKSLLITSPRPHDGKSAIALSLAIMLAEGGKRTVLLIEGDLHYPTLTHRLGLDQQLVTGLADCLERKIDVFSAIRRIKPLEIYLLPAGKTLAHPTELLQSDALSGIMQSLREQFDWVVVDSPPVMPLSDALLLRQRTDATLLVIRAGCTPRDAVDEAVALVGKKNILGMLLNGVEGLEQAYSKYYGSYGSHSPDTR
jgi:capsular exopolysaccharide synthesis family protein